MADETLQAFQLGASLYDRAQTQKRMMEQMQMQTADQLMRQRQYDLQNKIQSNAYAQALEEQTNQAAEYDTFQTFNQKVADFLNSTVEELQCQLFLGLSQSSSIRKRLASSMVLSRILLGLN